jgi:regulator of replication initiation timing
MTRHEEDKLEELKEANRKLLAENVDLKIQIEKMKSRIQALECVAKLIEGSMRT